MVLGGSIFSASLGVNTALSIAATATAKRAIECLISAWTAQTWPAASLVASAACGLAGMSRPDQALARWVLLPVWRQLPVDGGEPVHGLQGEAGDVRGVR